MDKFSTYQKWREMIRKQLANTDDKANISDWKIIRSAINRDDLQLALKRVAQSSPEVKKAVKKWQNEDTSGEKAWGEAS